MEGLEADEVKLSVVRSSSEELRIDSNYFHSDELLKRIDSFSGRPLAELSTWVTQGPNPVIEDEGTEGIPCLTGRNIRGHVISTEGADIVSQKTFEDHPKFHLLRGDILVTLKGAGSTGKMALVDKETPMMFSRNVGLVRLKAENHDMAEFLYAYFSCRHGQKLIDRGVTGGTGQLTLPTGYLKRFPIPNFPSLSPLIKEVVVHSKRKIDESEIQYKSAEQTLLKALGLEDWQPPELLTYTRRASEALAAARLDAEHFRPKFSTLTTKMEAHGKVVRLGDYLRFCERGRQPDYAEEGLRVINSRHVRTNNIVIDEENRYGIEDPAQLKLPEEDRLTIRQGDLLINGTGVGTMGRCAPYMLSENALPDNHVTILRPKNIEELDPIFLSVQLNSLIGQMQVEQYFKGSSGQIELYPSEIKEFRIWLGPIETQKKISKNIQSAHAARQEAQELLERAKRAVEVAIEEGEPSAINFLRG